MLVLELVNNVFIIGLVLLGIKKVISRFKEKKGKWF